MINNAENIDITPTVLHILGVPIPEDIEGKVLKGIFRKESKLATAEIWRVKAKDPESTQDLKMLGYTEEEEKLVEQRLRSFGYL